MNAFCLVINTDALSYTLHDQYCAQLMEPGKIVTFDADLDPEEDLVQAQKKLLPSWDFRPCNCLVLQRAHQRIS